MRDTRKNSTGPLLLGTDVNDINHQKVTFNNQQQDDYYFSQVAKELISGRSAKHKLACLSASLECITKAR